MTSLSSLLARIESATGPDREIDAALWLACFEPGCVAFDDIKFHTEHYDNYISRTFVSCDLGDLPVDQFDPPLLYYTASLDAAIALCERVLPGWSWTVDSGYAANHQKSHAEAWTGDDEGSGDAATPALALCAAIIKARMTT